MKLALVFPGQGSQSIGMMQGFAESKVVRDTFAECGPGKVLVGMTKRIDGNLRGLAIADPQSLAAALETVK